MTTSELMYFSPDTCDADAANAIGELCLQIKLLSVGNIKAILLKVCCIVSRKKNFITNFHFCSLGY